MDSRKAEGNECGYIMGKAIKYNNLLTLKKKNPIKLKRKRIMK